MSVEKVIESFNLSTDQLRAIIKHFHAEMELGLEVPHANQRNSSMKMLVSFVGKASGTEKGTYFALDLGGTNFRVIKLDLKGNGLIGENIKQQFTIPKEVNETVRYCCPITAKVGHGRILGTTIRLYCRECSYLLE